MVVTEPRSALPVDEPEVVAPVVADPVEPPPELPVVPAPDDDGPPVDTPPEELPVELVAAALEPVELVELVELVPWQADKSIKMRARLPRVRSLMDCHPLILSSLEDEIAARGEIRHSFFELLGPGLRAACPTHRSAEGSAVYWSKRITRSQQ